MRKFSHTQHIYTTYQHRHYGTNLLKVFDGRSLLRQRTAKYFDEALLLIKIVIGPQESRLPNYTHYKKTHYLLIPTLYMFVQCTTLYTIVIT